MYSYEDTLHQLVKALLARLADAEVADWTAIEVVVRPDELHAADDLILSVRVVDHVDPVTRHVTALARRSTVTSTDMITNSSHVQTYGRKTE